MSIFQRQRDFKILFVLIILRLAFMTSAWYIARDSYVFVISTEFRGNLFGSRTFTIGFFVLLLKLLTAIILELFFTIDFEEEYERLEPGTGSRMIQANIMLVLAELFLVLTTYLEIEGDLSSINYVLTIISSGSLFTLLGNQSEYITFWIAILFYVIGMIIYIFPRKSDPMQKNMEVSSSVLFVRSIFLPL